jgi:hypothetical protein
VWPLCEDAETPRLRPSQSELEGLMKSKRICLACGNTFVPPLHAPRQRYCSSKAFQRARRRD